MSDTVASVDKNAVLTFAIECIRSAHSPAKVAEMTIAELGLDSLNLVELQMELESRFFLELDIDTLSSEQVFSDMIASLTPLEN